MKARFVNACVWLLPLLVFACRLGGNVEPTPLRGEPPRVIAVWPLLAEPWAERRDELLGSASEAIQRRGYRPIAAAVAAQMLVDAGLTEAGDPAVAGATLRADAVLRCDLRRFDAPPGRPLRSADWDISWRLISTHGLGVVWSFDHNGTWRARDADPQDNLRHLDAEPDIVPIGGNGPPGFRDAAELMAWLHRLAMEHLPEALR